MGTDTLSVSVYGGTWVLCGFQLLCPLLQPRCCRVIDTVVAPQESIYDDLFMTISTLQSHRARISEGITLAYKLPMCTLAIHNEMVGVTSTNTTTSSLIDPLKKEWLRNI